MKPIEYRDGIAWWPGAPLDRDERHLELKCRLRERIASGVPKGRAAREVMRETFAPMTDEEWQEQEEMHAFFNWLHGGQLATTDCPISDEAVDRIMAKMRRWGGRA